MNELNLSRRDFLNIFYGETKEIYMVSDSKHFKEGYTSLILNIRTLVITLHDRQTSKQELSLQNRFLHTPLWADTDMHTVLMLYVLTGFQM